MITKDCALQSRKIARGLYLGVIVMVELISTKFGMLMQNLSYQEICKVH